ncbi:MAG TPA: molybdate ABC transporter substrate-binding protein [Helicobacteraceae bacterium]|nr:molybdate ABC transporter substrate-binding protein [Helicobacteraceae bacterium]
MKSFFALMIVMNVYAGEITVAVSANVSYAIDALKEAFVKQHPQVEVRIILGSSGKLRAQIEHGAPYGIFLSANVDYPASLYENGMGVEAPCVYAQGSLAMLSVTALDISKGMKLLSDSSIKTIAMANPKTAPYGKATLQALKQAHVYDQVVSKIIYGESISQTVAYTVNAADIGFIATSALFTPHMQAYQEGVHWIRVNNKLYEPIEQGMLLLNSTPEYRLFYDFMLSDTAQNILAAYGYEHL